MRIKWPNDVYATGMKLGGVLCQSAYRGGRFEVVVGVGLNLANRQPTTCVDALIEARHQQLGLPGATMPLQPEVQCLQAMLFACWVLPALSHHSAGISACRWWMCMPALKSKAQLF